MSDIRNDSRIVLTLDAGGTNLVFGAMKGGEYYGETLTLPSNASNLDLCLQAMVLGFGTIIEQLGEEKPVAISFAFPGPADYPNGIIGGFLPNFPSFRDGVALGPFLKEKFGVPVFINNDGDLYAYGEALGGALPEINASMPEKIAVLKQAILEEESRHDSDTPLLVHSDCRLFHFSLSHISKWLPAPAMVTSFVREA